MICFMVRPGICWLAGLAPIISGGTGTDTVSYALASAGVTASLSTGARAGDAVGEF